MRRMACAAAALVMLAAAPAAAQPAPRGEAAAAAPAAAREPTAAEKAQIDAEVKRLKELLDSLRPQRGDIAIREAEVTLKLTEAYYFLNAEDAKKLLVQGWGNPPEAVEGVLGMVFPAGSTPLDDNVWGAVVTWTGDGYVSDHDAKEIKPDELLKQLREGEEAENRARREAGYGETHLAGWAQPPAYDATRHALIWAKNIKFTGEDVNTLNYDVRLLGRKGVLSLNMVASMNDLPAVREASEKLQAVAQFNPGARYADYKEGDHRAAYGVAGLLASGLGLAAAKKVGLLAGLFLFLKKGLGIIIAGGAAVGAWLLRMFRGRQE